MDSEPTQLGAHCCINCEYKFKSQDENERQLKEDARKKERSESED